MANIQLDDHISRRFNEQLCDIHSRVLAMGGLVEQQLADGLKALIDGDAEIAERVVLQDAKVNAAEVSIDEDCTLILVSRQPAATDLRLVISVVKAITDLERIGDEAKRIARAAMDPDPARCKADIYVEIEHMGARVLKMLRDALDAFARMDAEAALAVPKQDQKVNHLYETVVRQMTTHMMEDPRSIPACLDVIWCARALERVGDHCCNICEHSVFFIKGENVRYTRPEEIERQVRRED